MNKFVFFNRLLCKKVVSGISIKKILFFFISRISHYRRIILCGYFDLVGVVVSCIPTIKNQIVKPKVSLNSCFRWLVLRHEHYGNGADKSLEYDQLDIALLDMGYDVFAVSWGSRTRSRWSLFKDIKSANPKFIVISSYSFGKNRPETQPSLAFLAFIKKMFPEIRFIAVWWDTCSKKFWTDFPDEHVFDLHVVVDNPLALLNNRIDLNANKFVYLYSTHPPGIQVKPESKDILLFFSGQVGSYRDYRKRFIDLLEENGFGEHLYSVDRESQLKKADYFNLMGRSLMVVNFSYSVDCHQLKGRVFEALLSGCLLLESRNPQIEAYFCDGIHYVAFDSPEDLLEKVKYYKLNPKAAKSIADSGRNRALKHFSTRNFWKAVERQVRLF